MPKRKSRRPSGPRAGRRQSGNPARRDSRPTGQPDLARQMEALLSEAHPLNLLAHASSTMAVFAPRAEHPLAPAREPGPDLPPLPELLEAFCETGPAPAAVAFAIGLLSGDELLQARVSRGIGPYRKSWPDWAARLDEFEPVGALQMVDPLHDSDDIVVHFRIGGADLSLVVLVDYNLGTVVKDAFALPLDLAGFTAFLAEHEPGAVPNVEPLSLADARARVAEAIETSDQTWPPMESDSWPASRSLLEWGLRQLPPDGAGFVRPDWSERRRTTLVRQFLQSPHADRLDGDDDATIAGDLIWFRTDWGFGDPLRWSPASVEILLLDWYPRKVMADQTYLRRMPTVLRAFVGFAHAEAKLSSADTAPTLAAVDQYEPGYLSQVGNGRRSSGFGGFGDFVDFAFAGPGDDDPYSDGLSDEEVRQHLIADAVGGVDALRTLDDAPLPDEPFNDSELDPDVRTAVVQVQARCDACCDVLFDLEHRTAVRRLLRDVAVQVPRSFTGRGSLDTAAAALCWLVAKANLEGGVPGSIPNAVLLEQCGLTTVPSGRADTFRRAVGADRFYSPGSLGSPRYLVSAQRRRLIELRDNKTEG